jgi:endoglucanase Acf2
MRTADPSRRAAPGGAVRLAACALTLLCATAGVATGAAADGTVAAGLGSYYTKAKGSLGADERPPVAEYRSGAALGTAPPTNQWYSAVLFERWSYPIHAHPMTYRPSEQGFELGLPDRRVGSPDAFQREVTYPHVAAIVVAPLDFKPQDARLAQFSDWLIELRMGTSDGKALSASVLHGSPFSYFECSSGDVRFRLAAKPDRIVDPAAAGSDPRVVAVTIAGHAYGLFGPTGARWEWTGPAELVLHLPAGARYFSVAGLPDSAPATVNDFLAVAYAFPTGTRADWSYDERASKVRTSFRVATVAREGTNLTTFMGLYPHQWSALAPQPASRYRYESVRGPIRLIAANSFTVERIYHGLMPLWPGLEDPAHRAPVDSLLGGDLAKSDDLYTHQQGRGTYWIGKALGANAQLLSVAEAQGRTSVRDELLGKLKRRLESWFDGRHATYFVEDATLGTFVGLPQEFHSYQSMNDHHFHYGYWLMAAAHVALRDPAWAAPDQWGGMVGKLIADIATDERGRSDYPFLRNFDAYEGHSWASGTSAGGPVFANGNNQESSSEAVNAWAGLVLWGEATGNRRLRDLGIYLYTTEIAAVQQYWFDLDHQVLGADFGKPFAVQVFGGKYAYNTWWTEEPHQIYGINMLPFTPASTYLGADPAYLRSIYALLPAEEKHYRDHGNIPSNPPPADIWQDALASGLALADADAALARWNKQGSVESGETRSRTLFWMLSLKELGPPDFAVTADTPLYAVFSRQDGVRTYLAYNARDTPLTVTFSTGKVLAVPPRSLARSR